jgi:hypothetical protein
MQYCTYEEFYSEIQIRILLFLFAWISWGLSGASSQLAVGRISTIPKLSINQRMCLDKISSQVPGASTDISQYRLRFGFSLLYKTAFHLHCLSAQLSYEGRAAVEGAK